MFYLLAAIACSIGTAMLFKVVELRGLDRMATLAVNYAAGCLAAGAIAGTAVGQLPAGAVALGTATGAVFLAGYFVFGAAIRRAGVGLSTGVMRLSVAVPVLGSWILYDEVPSTPQIVGLVLAASAFLLLAWPSDAREEAPRVENRAAIGLLFVLFVAGGSADLSMKVFARSFGLAVAGASFLVVVFGVAAALAASLVLTRGLPLKAGRPELLVGAVLGLINYGSADFIIRAAGVMPAALVFPTLAIAVLAGTAAIAFLVWGERISVANGVGLVVAAAALALLWGGGRPS